MSERRSPESGRQGLRRAVSPDTWPSGKRHMLTPAQTLLQEAGKP
ncbi:MULTISPECIES: hypothetical protein [Brasilonema]|nr:MULTISPECIES: hypothetical protein [Brasilonema]